jgi:hypothetical protein
MVTVNTVKFGMALRRTEEPLTFLSVPDSNEHQCFMPVSANYYRIELSPDLRSVSVLDHSLQRVLNIFRSARGYGQVAATSIPDAHLRRLRRDIRQAENPLRRS